MDKTSAKLLCARIMGVNAEEVKHCLGCKRETGGINRTSVLMKYFRLLSVLGVQRGEKGKHAEILQQLEDRGTLNSCLSLNDLMDYMLEELFEDE